MTRIVQHQSATAVPAMRFRLIQSETQNGRLARRNRFRRGDALIGRFSDRDASTRVIDFLNCLRLGLRLNLGLLCREREEQNACRQHTLFAAQIR